MRDMDTSDNAGHRRLAGIRVIADRTAVLGPTEAMLVPSTEGDGSQRTGERLTESVARWAYQEERAMREWVDLGGEA